MNDMAQRFDDLAPIWDSQFGPESAHGHEFRARVDYLRSICRELGRPRVLDLGCASGSTLMGLSDLVVHGSGVDIAPAMISKARQNCSIPHLEFHVADAAEFVSRASREFDLVTLVGVLDHLPDATVALSGIRRVLARNGRLVIISPHPWSPKLLPMRILEWTGISPPARHLAPSRLIKIGRLHQLEAVHFDALPYSPFGSREVLRTCGAKSSLRSNGWGAGIGSGAFAAVFRPFDKEAVQ